MDADPRPKPWGRATLATCRRTAEFSEDFEPSMRRARGVVLVGTRETEVDEDAVAEVLRHQPAVALDDLSADLAVLMDHVLQVLGIERFGEVRRPDEVAEHDCQMSALGPGLGRRTRRVKRQRDPAAAAHGGIAGVLVMTVSATHQSPHQEPRALRTLPCR